LGYIGGIYTTLDGALFSFGKYFSRTLFFSAFCASLFVYKKKGDGEQKPSKDQKNSIRIKR
jgi:hypothetical protein